MNLDQMEQRKLIWYAALLLGQARNSLYWKEDPCEMLETGSHSASGAQLGGGGPANE